MNYIFQNWSELNLIDRAWFLVGAWLLLLFIAMVVVKTYRRLRRKNNMAAVIPKNRKKPDPSES